MVIIINEDFFDKGLEMLALACHGKRIRNCLQKAIKMIIEFSSAQKCDNWRQNLVRKKIDDIESYVDVVNCMITNN